MAMQQGPAKSRYHRIRQTNTWTSRGTTRIFVVSVCSAVAALFGDACIGNPLPTHGRSTRTEKIAKVQSRTACRICKEYSFSSTKK